MKDTKIRSCSVVEEQILPRQSAQSVPQNPLAAVAAHRVVGVGQQVLVVVAAVKQRQQE